MTDLRRFAVTERQQQILDAYDRLGSLRAVARELGVAHQSVQMTVSRMRKRAALQGSPEPFGHGAPVPEPFAIKGTSRLDGFAPDGSRVPKLEWTKTNVPLDRQVETLKAAVQAAAETIEPVAPRAHTPEGDEDKAVFVAITDYHFGMYAWGAETGADWNLEIAERVFVETVDRLTSRAGSAQRCYLALMGDLLHTDNLSSKTPTSGHELDSAGRFPESVRAAVRAIRRAVHIVRQRFPETFLVVAEGNHDIVTSGLWLPELFEALYAKSDDVSVIKSNTPYHVFEWGQTMLGIHHGHMTKKENLPLFYAASFPEIWGRTTKRYIHTGHYHHLDEKGHMGCRVHQHTTLAANDAYSARAGYVPDREACAIVYSKTRGQVARIYEPPGV